MIKLISIFLINLSFVHAQINFAQDYLTITRPVVQNPQVGSDEICEELLDQSIRDYNTGFFNMLRTSSTEIAAQLLNLTALKMALHSRKNANSRSQAEYQEMIRQLSANIRSRDISDVQGDIMELYNRYGKADQLESVQQTLQSLNNGEIENIMEIDPSTMITLQYMYSGCDSESDSSCFSENDIANSWMMKRVKRFQPDLPTLIEQGDSYLQSMNNVENYINAGQDDSIEMLERRIADQENIIKEYFDEFLEDFTENTAHCSNYIENKRECLGDDLYSQILEPKFVNHLEEITNNESFVLMNQNALEAVDSELVRGAALAHQRLIDFAGDNLAGVQATNFNRLMCGTREYHPEGEWGINISMNAQHIRAIMLRIRRFQRLTNGFGRQRVIARPSVNFDMRTRDKNLCCNETNLVESQESAMSLSASFGGPLIGAFYGFPGIGRIGIRIGANISAGASYRIAPTCENNRNGVRCWNGTLGLSPYGEIYADIGGGLLEPALGVRADPRGTVDICQVNGTPQKAEYRVILDEIVVYGRVTYGWFFSASIDRKFEIGFEKEDEVVL